MRVTTEDTSLSPSPVQDAAAAAAAGAALRAVEEDAPDGVATARPQRAVPAVRAGLGHAAALLRLVRPLNVTLFVAGVVVGGVLVAEAAVLRDAFSVPLALAALSAALLGGAANAINDVFDVEIDRINRPGRPLPSGRVSVRTARGVWLGGTAAGLAVSLALTPAHVAMATTAAVLLFAYSAWFKRTVLVGNVLVALVVALALLYGGAAVGSMRPALVGAAFAFLTTLAREIVKDVEDVAGDAAAGARTLPVVFGRSAAVSVAAVVLAVTVALTPAPFLWLGYSSLYLLAVLGADVAMLRVLWLLQDSTSNRAVRRAGSLMKWAMVAGMVALVCAGVPE